ncbi:MAG: hypothetical protein ABIJ96_15685 [Elusimicrobiota bacterium]
MADPLILYYVSGHGYGHATRTVAVLEALRAQSPGLRLHVRSEAPHWLFTDAVREVETSSAHIDVGMIQADPIAIDLPASLRAHEGFGAHWEEAAVREADFIRTLRPDLVVSDIAALPFAAARAAGVRGIAVTNFSWDWILEMYAADEPRWRPIIERYAQAYGEAELLLRLPMGGALTAFRRTEDMPLVARNLRIGKKEARSRLGLKPDDARRIVLVTFGGFSTYLAPITGADELPDFIFIGFQAAPPGFCGEWRELAMHTPVPYMDLLAAADAMIGKPGFGTAAEGIAHGVPQLYLPRHDFRETKPLLAYLHRHGAARAMPHADFFTGRWRAHLEALLALPRTAPPGAGGAAAVAARLRELAQNSPNGPLPPGPK